MAALGHDTLVEAGYCPVGFDHFALPDDPLAQAAMAGRLRRNFQGFTEDQAPVLVGLGASAISSFPELLAQNEKNSGRYRMLLSQPELPVALGVHRSADDRRRGRVIESLLCNGWAEVGSELARQADAWDKAIIRKDRDAIAENMAEDFRQISARGDVAGKAAFLDAIMSPKLAINPYGVEDMDVRVYGDVALVSGRTRMTGSYEGKPFGSHYRYIDVYVRKEGKWRVASVQITPIPE